MRTYRAAVIGLGRMGSTFDDEIGQGGSIFLPYCHAPSYIASPLTELIAGADPHDEQRTLFGQRWGLTGDHLYADHREMLARERPDIVSVCTTAKVRPAVVEDAARAGARAIWAEKPLAFSLAEADGMVRVCREQGTALAVNCARRWNPFFSEAKRMIVAGELGSILQVTGYGQCGLSHNGSHLIDIVRYMAGGEVSWAFGEMESDAAAAGEDDLMGNGYLAFDNGARGFVRGMRCGPANWEVDVIGEQARVRATADAAGFELLRLEGGGRRGRGQPVAHPFPWPARMQGMGLTILEDLVEAIGTGRPPRCSGEDGVAALEVALALRESHRKGGIRVNLPLPDRDLAIRSAETLQGDQPVRVRRQART